MLNSGGRFSKLDRGADGSPSDRVIGSTATPVSVQRLRETVGQITLEEFRWQESHYDHDSRQGRELLFLMANSEWIRASSEIIEVNRSDPVETLIKIDVDLDQITHEAFRKRTCRFWLPGSSCHRLMSR